MNTEEWRAVVGYEGLYEVSNLGRVRSLDRIVTNSRGHRTRLSGQLLKQQPGDGRPSVALSRDGVEKTTRVLNIVARAFLGERPASTEVCHNNGDASDNRAANLRYDTRSANILDNVKHGTHWQTRKTHCPQGHVYDLVRSEGGRRCSICRTASDRRKYERKKMLRSLRST